MKNVIKSYDYLVIGGGSGGMASARRAATYGANVAVIERGRKYNGAGLGGTCVHYGCVPKKIMYNTAFHAEIMENASNYSFENVNKINLNWNHLKKKRDAYIHKLNGIYERNLIKSNIDIIEGIATFLEPKIIQVNDINITAKNILIAVGGEPILPKIEGIEHCITSDGFFQLENQPKKVAVIGAGYIAVEIAGIFNALKTDTTIFCRGKNVLRHFDSMITDMVNEEMRKSGVKFITESSIEKIIKNNDGSLSIETKLFKQNNESNMNENTIFHGYDCVLIAIGRSPRTKELNLEKTGIKTTKTNSIEYDNGLPGYIVVDKQENTSVEGIHAIGDVTSTGWELTPVAIAAGRRLADRLFGGEKDACLHYHQIPTVIFSHPPVGTIGCSEAEAKKLYGNNNIKVYTSSFTNLFYSMYDDIDKKPKTGMKLICAGIDEKVVGLHVVGLGADEILQGFGVSIKMGATKKDFDNCVAIHPTAGEELVTMAPWGMIKDKIALSCTKDQEINLEYPVNEL